LIWTSACGSGAGPSATAGFPMIQPSASASEIVTAFQLVMVPPFQRGEKHEARQAASALARLGLCSWGHYAAGGGVSYLPRFFLLKNQKASMTRPMISPILKTKKRTGRSSTEASFQRPMPRIQTAASVSTGFITRSDCKGRLQYAEGLEKCQWLGEKLRGLGARGWWRSHPRQRPTRVRPARAQPFGQPQRQRPRALDRLLPHRGLGAGEHLLGERLHRRHVIALRRRFAQRAR